MVNNVEQNESINVSVQTEELSLMHPPSRRIRRGASSSNAKERANNRDGCNDLASLPDEILEKILGFLEVRQLAQFNTVAKKFRFCSKYGKRLNFDLSFHRELLDNDQYQSIVSQIIEQHDGPKIRSLKLSFYPENNLDNQAMVAHWINKASQKEVEELELNFDYSLDFFRVPSDILFQIKTLKSLHLVFVDLGSPTNDFQFTGLRFLKVCSMKMMRINVVIIDALLKSCTELEILEIIQCCTPDHLMLFARNLNKFRKFRLAGCTSLREIIVDSPSLTTVHYSGPLISFHFENCESFVDFLVDLKSNRWAIFNVNHFMLNNLMLSLLRIEVMTTTSMLLERLCTKFVEAGMKNMFYSFPNVKEINLTLKGSRRCNLFTIAYFLNKFPACERIFIDFRGWFQDIQLTPFQLYCRRIFAEANSSDGDHTLEQHPPVQLTIEETVLANQALVPTYPRLEQLKLIGFRFGPNEMDLLRYFLRNGDNLKTVAIFPASPRHWRSAPPDEAMFNNNLRRMITSPNLRIKIFQHKQEKELYPAKHPKNWQKG